MRYSASRYEDVEGDCMICSVCKWLFSVRATFCNCKALRGLLLSYRFSSVDSFLCVVLRRRSVLITVKFSIVIDCVAVSVVRTSSGRRDPVSLIELCPAILSLVGVLGRRSESYIKLCWVDVGNGLCLWLVRKVDF